MNSVYIDSKFNDEKRREFLYNGQLFVYSPRPSSLAFTNFAAEMIKEAFGKEEPTTAQFGMPVEEFDLAVLTGEIKDTEEDVADWLSRMRPGPGVATDDPQEAES